MFPLLQCPLLPVQDCTAWSCEGMDNCRTLELSPPPTPFSPLSPLPPPLPPPPLPPLPPSPPLPLSPLPLQLHAPRDAGQRGFWLDINSASHTLSLNVEDPYPPGPPGPQGGSDLWENVSVSNAVLKSWTITSECGHVQYVYTRAVCLDACSVSRPCV